MSVYLRKSRNHIRPQKQVSIYKAKTNRLQNPLTSFSIGLMVASSCIKLRFKKTPPLKTGKIWWNLKIIENKIRDVNKTHS